MMPLTMSDIGTASMIKKIGGNEKTKRFLESLGFITGSQVIIISKNQGDVIVNVKDTRVALSRELANKIMV